MEYEIFKISKEYFNRLIVNSVIRWNLLYMYKYLIRLNMGRPELILKESYLLPLLDHDLFTKLSITDTEIVDKEKQQNKPQQPMSRTLVS